MSALFPIYTLLLSAMPLTAIPLTFAANTGPEYSAMIPAPLSLLAADPYATGRYPVGEFEYNYEDYFDTLGEARDVDLRAVVRYPAIRPGKETPVAGWRRPLFLIQHGNHFFCEQKGYSHATCPESERTPNHKGYMRLLETLASHGIIAVSIDAYDLTGPVPQWIPERGGLIMKHLRLWAHMNNASAWQRYPDPGAGLFSGRVDMRKVAVSGHSRGGEAAIAAYTQYRQLQNTLSQEEAFGIVAVASIAPTDHLDLDSPVYTPEGVPYLVLLPAADGDVDDLSGMRIYDRMGAGNSDRVVKSGFYIYGANHNYFNTVWASHYDDAPYESPNRLSPQQQQRIGEAYMAAFARLHLKGEIAYREILRSNWRFLSSANAEIYHFHHESNHHKVEDGSDKTSRFMEITKASVAGPSVHTSSAVRLGWSSPAATITYSLTQDQRDVSFYRALTFRVAQSNSQANSSRDSQNFHVELVSGGHAETARAICFDRIPRPYPRPDFVHNVMTTVRIPLWLFTLKDSDIDLENIDAVIFRFNAREQGEIYVDDVEFSH